MSVYTGSDTFPDSRTLADEGDELKAASVDPAFATSGSGDIGSVVT